MAQGFTLLGVLFAVPADLGERNFGRLVGFLDPAAGLASVLAARFGVWRVSRQRRSRNRCLDFGRLPMGHFALGTSPICHYLWFIDLCLSIGSLEFLGAIGAIL